MQVCNLPFFGTKSCKIVITDGFPSVNPLTKQIFSRLKNRLDTPLMKLIMSCCSAKKRLNVISVYIRFFFPTIFLGSKRQECIRLPPESLRYSKGSTVVAFHVD